MKKQMTARLKAMSIHLCISAVLFISTALLLIYHYFPSVNFYINGGWQGLRLMFMIDIVLGPLITFLIYNPNKPKKEIRSDFCLVAIIQVAALVYGGWHIYQQHPRFLLLNPLGVIESVTKRQFAGDLSTLDFSQMPMLAGLPLVAYDENSKKNQGLVSPEFAKPSAIRAEKIVVNESPDTVKDNYVLARKQYPNDVLLRLVGSYKTRWILVNNKWQETALLGEENTL